MTTFAFALEVHHPSSGLKRLVVLTLKALYLLEGGQLLENAHFGRGRTPEMVAIQWWRPTEPPSFHRVAPRGSAPSTELPLHNGQPRESSALEPGDTLRWREFLVTISALPVLQTPELAMVDAARTSDGALQVFADWLETHGESHRAEWTRLVLAPPGDPARTTRMSELASSLSPTFRALVARGPIERCTRAGCPSRWERLALKTEPWLRSCATCERAVTWCPDTDVGRAVAGPVVLDPVTPRTPGDLLPRPIPVG